MSSASPPIARFGTAIILCTIARTANLAGMKIYFDCGSEDDYGFECRRAGPCTIFCTRGAFPTSFTFIPGGHNWSYFAAPSFRFAALSIRGLSPGAILARLAANRFPDRKGASHAER